MSIFKENTNWARLDNWPHVKSVTAVLWCVGQLKIPLMSPVNVDQHPRTQFILFLLCFMFYCAPLRYHNIKTELENKHNYKYMEQGMEGGCTELLIGGLMLFDDYSASYLQSNILELTNVLILLAKSAKSLFSWIPIRK